jgi:nickel/cobalt transporter (NicO) family protein
MRPARRMLAVMMLGGGLFGCMGVMVAPAALAHPLGNFTVNRATAIEVGPGSVVVRYVIDLAEIPTFQEMERIDADGDGTVKATERQSWADDAAATILANVRLTADGRRVALVRGCAAMELRAGQGGLSTLRLDATFTGSLPASGRAVYRDTNDPDRLGWREVTVRAGDGAVVVHSSVPSDSPTDGLERYPADLLASPLAVSEASFSFRSVWPTGGLASGCGGEPARPAASTGGGFSGLVSWRLTPLALGLSLLVAFAFGAIHALGPGHGKTIMAAYLVGAGARARQAVAVGAAVSVMHTASVLGLGMVALLVSRAFPSETVYPWLGVATGALALILGGGLLIGRIRGRDREAIDGHDHGHGQPHSQPHDQVERPSVAPVSRRGLAAMALSGGILPSPTALVVLLGTIALGRLAYGLALIAAFSLGLAFALVVVGTIALRAGDIVSRRLGQRVSGWVPLGSAGVIVAAGLFLTARAVLQLA